MFLVFALICVGLIGACLFTTGIIFGMMPLTVSGIVLLALAVLCMILWYVYYKKPQGGQSPMSVERQVPVVAYTTNNMNTMKRNKSDTDLELIGSQG